MKPFLIIVCVALALFSGYTPSQPAPSASFSPTNAPTSLPAKAEYRKITPKEAKAMMDDGEPYILLDVRTQEEYDAERIAGAILIPDYELESRAESDLPDQNARILIYCRSGRRSALAAEALVKMGYVRTYDFGGILGWPYGTEHE